MDIRLRAAGKTAGTFAIIFGVIFGIHFLAPEQASLIIALSLVAYLAYLMYEVKLSQMQWDEQKSTEKTDR